MCDSQVVNVLIQCERVMKERYTRTDQTLINQSDYNHTPYKLTKHV